MDTEGKNELDKALDDFCEEVDKELCELGREFASILSSPLGAILVCIILVLAIWILLTYLVRY